MLKSIVPALLIAGAAMSAQAADGDKLLGFEFGIGYHLVDDSRYEGTDVNFGLVLPIGQKFDVVVYHEIGRFYGKQNNGNAKSNITSDANELRFRLTAWEGETQAVKIFLGIGYTNLHEDEGNFDWSANVADIGINFTALKTKSGPVKAELAINALYRYCKFEDQNVNIANPQLNKLGGFVIGVSAGLFF